LEQRRKALKRANSVRIRRAQLKKTLKHGTRKIEKILLNPPDYVVTMKVRDLLMAVPKFGKTKAARLLTQCQIGHQKRVGELSDRQREALIRHFTIE
jgi:hypothetical protein